MIEFKYDEVNLDYKLIKPEESSNLPPIILLHGVTSAKETWDNVIKQIADNSGRQVFALDARNHGESDWSKHFSYDVAAEDVLRFMQKKKFSKATLIGHSFGGKTAMLLALKQPDFVEKLVIEDITPKPLPRTYRLAVSNYIHKLRDALEHIPSEVKDLNEAKRIVESYLQEEQIQDRDDKTRNSSDGAHLPIKQDGDSFKWKTNLDIVEEALRSGFQVSTEWNGLCLKPVFFLYGTKSPYNVIKDEDFIKTLFPNSSFKAFEGADHQIHLEYPQEFLEEVLNFINAK